MSKAIKRTISTMETSQPFAPQKKRRVVRKKTTLQSADGPLQPFPRSKIINLIYENALAPAAGATPLFLGTKPNSAFDYDNGSGVFGNKQPLYYDSLFSVSGPYKNYKVDRWTTTYTISNESDKSITVFVMPPLSSANEIDIVAEADNFPGVKRLYLTPKTGSKSIGTISVTGNVQDVYTSASGRTVGDLGFVGSYNTDPAYLIYAGLLIASADGTTAVACQVSVRHVMHTTCEVVDALVS